MYNSGKTFKMENLYRYKKSTESKGIQKSQSVVFRPNRSKTNFETENKDIVYHNCYRFDIIKSKKHMRRTWVHICDNMPGYT